MNPATIDLTYADASKGQWVTNLNEQCQRCHKEAIKWWKDLETGEWVERPQWQLMALIHSEISEALEGVRKNLTDEKCPDFSNEEVELCDALIRAFDYAGRHRLDLDKWNYRLEKLNFEEEITLQSLHDQVYLINLRFVRIAPGYAGRYADGAVRDDGLAFDIWTLVRKVEFYAHKRGLKLWGAYEAKLEYNRNRSDHKVENRKKEGGKAF